MRNRTGISSRIIRTLGAGITLLLSGNYALFRSFLSVRGFLYPHEAVFLYRCARGIPGNEPIVEIGSMRGLSTVCLALGEKGKKQPATVTAIDPHRNGTESILRGNLSRCGVSHLVNVIVAPAEEVATGWITPCRLLFIDGAHDVASVLGDYSQWFPWLRPGGLLLLHDSTTLSSFPGPVYVAGKKLVVGPDFDATGTIGSITWGRKRGAQSYPLPSVTGSTATDTLLRLLKSVNRS